MLAELQFGQVKYWDNLVILGVKSFYFRRAAHQYIKNKKKGQKPPGDTVRGLYHARCKVVGYLKTLEHAHLEEKQVVWLLKAKKLRVGKKNEGNGSML